jgi:hypothetical protein
MVPVAGFEWFPVAGLATGVPKRFLVPILCDKRCLILTKPLLISIRYPLRC